jgi:hypothetical protein
MTKPTRSHEGNQSGETEQLIHEYMRRCGQLIPQTPEEVAMAEAWIAKHDIAVPETLRSAKGCSLPTHQTAARLLKFPKASSVASNDVTQCLARAAREGKSIPPEVEEQMKRDREQKEREAKGGK